MNYKGMLGADIVMKERSEKHAVTNQYRFRSVDEEGSIILQVNDHLFELVTIR